MVTAAINDNWYNIVLLLHLLSVIIGTGAAFLAPVLLSQEQKETKLGTSPMSSLLGTMMSPALLLGGVFGGALVGMSDDVYDFGQTWLAIGGGLWLLVVGSAALAFPPSFFYVYLTFSLLFLISVIACSPLVFAYILFYSP